jgi:ComF family protein
MKQPNRPSSTKRATRGRRATIPACASMVRIALGIARTALPQPCVLCGATRAHLGGNAHSNMPHRVICRGCDAAYWNEPRLRCRACALPLSLRGASQNGETRYLCGNCRSVPPPFERTLALADYRAPLERLALGLKFHARLFVAREFAQGLARLAVDSLAPEQWPDVVAPVPLAHERLVERGFNQAWEIAKPLARALEVPADATLLRRVAHTAPQSRLDLDARRRNVGAAFAVARPVGGAHVALVDDVMTSGATLEAAARALKTAGAREVTNFVGLRTPKD